MTTAEVTKPLFEAPVSRLIDADGCRRQAPQADPLPVAPDRLRAGLNKAGEHRVTRLAAHRFHDRIADQECNVQIAREVLNAARQIDHFANDRVLKPPRASDIAERGLSIVQADA